MNHDSKMSSRIYKMLTLLLFSSLALAGVAPAGVVGGGLGNDGPTNPRPHPQPKPASQPEPAAAPPLSPMPSLLSSPLAPSSVPAPPQASPQLGPQRPPSTNACVYCGSFGGFPALVRFLVIQHTAMTAQLTWIAQLHYTKRGKMMHQGLSSPERLHRY